MNEKMEELINERMEEWMNDGKLVPREVDDVV